MIWKTIKKAILFCLISAKAFGFSLNSSSSSTFKGWGKTTIKFVYNSSNCPSGVDVVGIIGDAFEIWNNVTTSNLKLALVGTTSSVTYSDPVTIMCDTNYASGDAATQASSPGAASVLPSSGDYITTGVMYLNASGGAANIGNLSRTLVAITLAHEIGHLLGLGHSQDQNALMYYSISGKTNLALAQDDIDGVSYLYPRNELNGDNPFGGCGTIGIIKPPSSGMMMAMLLCFLLPVLLVFGLKRSERELT